MEKREDRVGSVEERIDNSTKWLVIDNYCYPQKLFGLFRWVLKISFELCFGYF